MNTPISSFMLENGLKVAVIPRPDCRTVSISLRVLAGSSYEQPDEMGVAHFLEHIVFDGTEKYPTTTELNMLIEERGGFRNASTNKETVEYMVKVLKEDTETACEYLSELVTRPLIKEDAILKQKKIIEQEINRYKADPEKYSDRLIYKTLFPTSRLGVLNTGDVENVKSITREKIIGYMERTHVAKNMAIAISGDITVEEITKLAKKYFPHVLSGKKIEAVRAIESPLPNPLVEIRDMPLSYLTVGYPGFYVEDVHKYAADLLYNILFRGKGSRLVSEIREKRTLSYFVNGSNICGRNAGIFTIKTSVPPNKIAECREIIANHLLRLTAEPVSEEELNKAFAFLKADTAFSMEDTMRQASYYSRELIMSGKVSTFDEILGYYKMAKKPESIMETAKLLFGKTPGVLIIGKPDKQD
jgi:predicted Zn-dependent peptidase